MQIRCFIYAVLILSASYLALGQGTAPNEAVPAEAKTTRDYDLSMLPESLRGKIKLYLKNQAELDEEIKRMDSMLKASSNAWARQRATGMATKLNYELREQRKLRRDISRDYRELLREGWEPPEGMDFDNLLSQQKDDASEENAPRQES